jgi:hypothetical protein
MAITLMQLAVETLNRLEEANPPVFWSLQGEVYPAIIFAANEAALITGEPEVIQTTPFVLEANTSFFTLPPAAIALLRIQAPQWITKTSLWDMDRMLPGWESDVGPSPDYWFPMGLTQFCIHPQLQANVNAFLTYLALPVPTITPYTGLETLDYQPEFAEGIIDYAAHLLQAKEGGEEFKSSAKLYDRFLAKMTQLSNFSYRTGSIKFTRSVGPVAKITEKESA